MVDFCDQRSSPTVCQARKISVIIPAKNDEKPLNSTLKQLCKIRAEEYRNIEIIVGITRSVDRTAEIAKKYADTVVEVGSGPSRARNEAALHATGDIFLFLDADTIPMPGTISEIARKVDNGTIGTCVMRPDVVNWKSRILAFYKNLIRRRLHRGCSELVFCNRELFIDRNIRFNSDLRMGEISDFFHHATTTGKARYIYLRNVHYLFSVRRYETLGYNKVISLWIKWSFLRCFDKARRRLEDKYWSAGSS